VLKYSLIQVLEYPLSHQIDVDDEVAKFTVAISLENQENAESPGISK